MQLNFNLPTKAGTYRAKAHVYDNWTILVVGGAQGVGDGLYVGDNKEPITAYSGWVWEAEPIIPEAAAPQAPVVTEDRESGVTLALPTRAGTYRAKRYPGDKWKTFHVVGEPGVGWGLCLDDRTDTSLTTMRGWLWESEDPLAEVNAAHYGCTYTLPQKAGVYRAKEHPDANWTRYVVMGQIGDGWGLYLDDRGNTPVASLKGLLWEVVEPMTALLKPVLPAVNQQNKEAMMIALGSLTNFNAHNSESDIVLVDLDKVKQIIKAYI